MVVWHELSHEGLLYQCRTGPSVFVSCVDQKLRECRLLHALLRENMDYGANVQSTTSRIVPDLRIFHPPPNRGRSKGQPIGAAHLLVTRG